MQELNYLKDKVITPGTAPFVSHATYPVEDGHADLWLYDIFPGVQLMVTDFACETCFQDGMEQDVIGIHHCARGRFECVFDHWNYVYMGEGDIALNSMLHPPIGASFPLKDYFGSTIILYPRTCDDLPELALKDGYIPTNDKMETAIPGGIRVKQVRQVATAVSDGAIAAFDATM